MARYDGWRQEEWWSGSSIIFRSTKAPNNSGLARSSLPIATGSPSRRTTSESSANRDSSNWSERTVGGHLSKSHNWLPARSTIGLAIRNNRTISRWCWHERGKLVFLLRLVIPTPNAAEESCWPQMGTPPQHVVYVDIERPSTARRPFTAETLSHHAIADSSASRRRNDKRLVR